MKKGRLTPANYLRALRGPLAHPTTANPPAAPPPPSTCLLLDSAALSACPPPPRPHSPPASKRGRLRVDPAGGHRAVRACVAKRRGLSQRRRGKLDGRASGVDGKQGGRHGLSARLSAMLTGMEVGGVGSGCGKTNLKKVLAHPSPCFLVSLVQGRAPQGQGDLPLQGRQQHEGHLVRQQCAACGLWRAPNWPQGCARYAAAPPLSNIINPQNFVACRDPPQYTRVTVVIKTVAMSRATPSHFGCDKGQGHSKRRSPCNASLQGGAACARPRRRRWGARKRAALGRPHLRRRGGVLDRFHYRAIHNSYHS